ncbi:MAG: hypothetical protein AAB676_06370 [Verrucomicrobiota bacterium]
MQVISTHDAESNLTRLLASVEAGEEFVIARGQKLVAKLVPFTAKPERARPKVGEMISPPFEVPVAALGPLTPDELKHWGL